MSAQVEAVRKTFLDMQTVIIDRLEDIDGKASFGGEEFQSSSGSLSKPQVLERGKQIEKAAVLFTHGIGDSLPPAASERNPHLAGEPFQAISISIIVHPWNPHVPTSHMNLRFFLVRVIPTSWYFGGGFDLTPYIPYLEDAQMWHECARRACDDRETYALLKKQCDEYFYLPHRNECRGIGGLFFDDWTGGGFEACLEFTQRISEQYLKGYSDIFMKRCNTPWSEEDEEWMLVRRGRYAEFNLAIDRGTTYGLQSGRRVESVLASLPPRASWRYNFIPTTQQHKDLIAGYLKPRDWIL